MFLQSKILYKVDQHKRSQATIGGIDVDCWEAGKKYLHFKVEQVEENETS